MQLRTVTALSTCLLQLNSLLPLSSGAHCERVSGLRVFLLILLFSLLLLLFNILNFTSISRAESNPEQRTRSQQTSTAQQAGLALLVDNPEQLLHRRCRRTGIQAVDLNLESDTLGFVPLMLGSPSDIKLNLFLDHNIDPSRPIVPGQFRLLISTAIFEESFIEHDLDSAQHQANSNFQVLLMQSNTPTSALPTI